MDAFFHCEPAYTAETNGKKICAEHFIHTKRPHQPQNTTHTAYIRAAQEYNVHPSLNLPPVRSMLKCVHLKWLLLLLLVVVLLCHYIILSHSLFIAKCLADMFGAVLFYVVCHSSMVVLFDYYYTFYDRYKCVYIHIRCNILCTLFPAMRTLLRPTAG